METLTPPKNSRSSNENEADRTTELFHRVKQGSLSYTSEIRARSGSAELSQADDVNTETLRRLAPSAEPWAQHGNLRALVVIDWDDTLFPTSWSSSQYREQSEYRDAADAAVTLLRAARKAGDVVIVTLGTEDWLRTCIERVGNDEFSNELAGLRILYAREIEDVDPVWARSSFLERSSGMFANNFGVLLTSTAWDSELRAQLVSAKMAAMKRGLVAGCQQVVSIGDSEIERWAVHDLPFACEDVALVKTIKFEEGLSVAALTESLQTTAGFLTQFVRLSVAMDIEIRSSDAMFPLDLQFAMQSASRPQGFAERPARGACGGVAATIWHEV
jgi:hypothetical protein